MIAYTEMIFLSLKKNIYSIVKWLNIIYDFLTEVTINVVPYPVLTVASWPAYKFIRRQVKCWYSHLFQNFPQFIMAHTVKGFGIINKAEIHVFFWNSLVFSMIQWMLAIWSLVPLPFLNPAWSSGSSRFTNCWSLAWRILSINLLASEERNCVVLWAFFGIAFLCDWNENWSFPVLWPLPSFPICWNIVCSTFTASSFRI